MNELALNSVPYFGLLISGIVTTLGLSMNSILTLPVLSFMMLELFWNQSFRFKSNLYKMLTYEMVNLSICSLLMVDFYVQFSKWNFIKLKWKWISYCKAHSYHYHHHPTPIIVTAISQWLCKCHMEGGQLWSGWWHDHQIISFVHSDD